MTGKQLSEFPKGQIVAYNDCELSLCDITKKLDCSHSSIDVFHQNYKKVEIIYLPSVLFSILYITA